MTNPRQHKHRCPRAMVATFMLAALALAACGGSGGDGNANGSPGNGNVEAAGDVTLEFPPAPSQGEAFTSLTVENTGSSTRSDFPITFGQVFWPGAIGPGETLTARTEAGTSVPLQIDRKATHRDNSLRHAVVTARVPTAIAAGEALDIELVKSAAANSSGSSPTKSELISGSFDAGVSLTLDGSTYTASAADLLKNTAADVWLAGDMVREWLVSGPVETAGGDAHPHLTARFHIRAYSQNDVRVAVIVENTKTFEPNPDTRTYHLKVTVNGTKVLEQAEVEHHISSRWRRIFWTGTSPVEQWHEGLRKGIHIAHDGDYLQDTGAVPEYIDGLNVPSGTLDDMLAAYEDGRASGGGSVSSNGTGLLEIGSLNPDMPAAGFQPDIGLHPRWVARYVISQDERAKRVTIGNAEQAGSWSIHYRDETAEPNLPVSIDDHPGLNTDGWGCGDCNSPAGPDGRENASGRDFDVAHQPEPNAVPYIVTGDYYFLEELQFWATFDLLETLPRADSGRGLSAGVIHVNQQRGQAWALRTIAYAQYLTPDDHPSKSYWSDKLEHNRDWYTASYAHGNTDQVEHASTIPNLEQDWDNDLGWIGRGAVNRDPNLISPWMDDFMTAVVGQIVTGFRYTDWTEFFQFKARFPVARLTDPQSDADGWCYLNASAGKITISDNETQAEDPSIDTISDGTLTSMLAVYRETAANTALDFSNWTKSPVADCQGSTFRGNPDNPRSQFANLQPAVAVAADSGAPGAEAAYRRFCGRPTDQQPSPTEWAIDPEWAIQPRVTTCE